MMQLSLVVAVLVLTAAIQAHQYGLNVAILERIAFRWKYYESQFRG